MTRIGPGRYAVAPGERITIVIEKQLTPYSAIETDLFGGPDWSPPPSNNGSLNTSGAFIVPARAGITISFGVLFNFVPSGDGGNLDDFYTITISGSGGGSFPSFVDPPGAPTRTFTFFS